MTEGTPKLHNMTSYRAKRQLSHVKVDDSWHTYCRQPQRISLVFATCFGTTDHPRAFKYKILKLKIKHIYLCVVSQIVQAIITFVCRSQWPRGLRRGSATARLLRSWVRIQPGAWMSVCCECCVLSGELITRPEESYRLWCVIVCDLETSRMRRPWPALGHSATGKKIITFMW